MNLLIKSGYFVSGFLSLFFRIRLKLLYYSRIKFGENFSGRLKILFDFSQSFLEFGNGVEFRDNCKILIQNNGKLIINDNVFFNNGCSINCLHHIEIGANTIFGEDVKIYDHNHRFSDKTKLIKDQGFSLDKITIGNNCWISSNVVILKGVFIGDNSVIGANCLIFRNVPANTVVKSKSELEFKSLMS